MLLNYFSPFFLSSSISFCLLFLSPYSQSRIFCYKFIIHSNSYPNKHKPSPHVKQGVLFKNVLFFFFSFLFLKTPQSAHQSGRYFFQPFPCRHWRLNLFTTMTTHKSKTSPETKNHPQETDKMSRLKNLHEAVCISHCTGKGMNPSFLYPALGKYENRLVFLTLVLQPGKDQEDSKSKLAELHRKIDFVSHFSPGKEIE